MLTYWEKPQVVNLENSLEFLVGFYGTGKVQLVGSSTNNTIAPLIDGNLLLAQAKRFKEIMHDTVPAIRAAVEKRKREERARKLTAHMDEQTELVSEEEQRSEAKSVTQYVWAYLFKAGERHDISEFVKLAVIMLIIPVSSVQAERLFSCMNFLKNDHRNRLGEKHLNDCVRLFMSEYGMRNFPYEKALDYFLTTKDRRGVTAGPSVSKRPWSVAFNEGVLDAIMDDENE
jgi:hypothetical protein